MLKVLTPAQCRGARALLDMTQPELARRAQVGLSTVVDFERERRSVSPEAVRKMQQALETSGIEFIDENGGGLGVRFRKRAKQISRTK
jgi:transcriptional regulator with XRE-family HTH domain